MPKQNMTDRVGIYSTALKQLRAPVPEEYSLAWSYKVRPRLEKGKAPAALTPVSKVHIDKSQDTADVPEVSAEVAPVKALEDTKKSELLDKLKNFNQLQEAKARDKRMEEHIKTVRQQKEAEKRANAVDKEAERLRWVKIL